MEDLLEDIHDQMADYAYSLSRITSPSGKGGSLGPNDTGQGFEVQEEGKAREELFQADDGFLGSSDTASTSTSERTDQGTAGTAGTAGYCRFC